MSNKKILIVDDDPEVRYSLRVLLTANQYDVFFAEDGVTAISEARKQMPDLILLDLGLPAGDGFTVLERITSNSTLSAIPVIVVSGRNRETSKERALQAGAQAFLQKPGKERRVVADPSTVPAPAAIAGSGDSTRSRLPMTGLRNPAQGISTIRW